MIRRGTPSLPSSRRRLILSRRDASIGASPYNWIIPEDANTVDHVGIVGGALYNPLGRGWVEVGTVPKIASQVLTGFANGKKAESAGVFSSSNYFQIPAGATGPYEISTPFMLTMIVGGSDFATSSQVFLSHGSQQAGQGYQFEYIGSGDEQALIVQGGSMFAFPSNTSAIGGNRYDVLTWGWDGSKWFFHVNGTTNAQLPGVGDQFNGWGAYPVRIGLAAGASSPPRVPLNNTFVEMRLSLTTPTDPVISALHTAITG